MMSNTAPRSRRHRRRRSIIKEFLANSTIDGLKNISDAANVHASLFWVFAFLLCLSVMFYFCTLNLIEYYQYKSKTDLQFLSAYSSIFPAFTICNSAELRSDRIQQPLIDYLYNKSLIKSNNYSQTLSQALSAEFYPLITSLMNTGLAEKDLIGLTFTLDVMLLSCTYNQQKCNYSDFDWFYSSTYGSCYTFNAMSVNKTINDLRTTTENAGNGELDLQLYAHSQLYFGDLDGTSGMVAMVHDNQQLPHIENQGLYLEPNQKHSLLYTKSQITYLGAPYTPCTTEIRSDMRIFFEKYDADYQYSQEVCYILCGQAFTYQQCNCVDAKIWTYNNVYVNNEVIKAKLCINSSLCVKQAGIIFDSNQSLQMQYCSHCAQECEIVKYNIIFSSIKAPTIWNYPSIKQQVEQQFKNITLPLDWSSNYQTYIDQNYVAVKVIKSTYNVESYAQQPDKTVGQLISAIGGQTVLWIGFSCIAIFEILVLIYQLIHRLCSKQQEQKTRVQPAVQVAVLELNRKTVWTNNDFEDTQSVDEAIIVN